MPYYLRDVATSLLDGSLHKVRSVNSTSSYCVDEGPATDAPCTISSIRLAVDGLGASYELVTAGDAYSAILVRHGDMLWSFAGDYGAGMGALRPLASGVEVYLMDPNFDPVTYQTVVNVYDVTGKWLRAIPVAYQSTGIAQINPDGSVVMDDQSALQPTINGVKFYNVRRVAGFTMGQINAPGLGLVKPDGSMWQLPIPVDGWNGFSDQPSSLAVSGDGLTVWPAIPGVDTPEPDRLTFSEPLVATEPHVTVPEVITGLSLPLPSEPLPPCWFGGEYGAPGNFQWGYTKGDPRPVLDQLCRWEEFYGTEIPTDANILCGYLGSDDGADYTDAEIAVCKARGVKAIYVHIDDPEHATRMWIVRDRVIAAGLTAIMGGHNPPYPAPWGITRSYHFGWDGTRYVREPQGVADEQVRLTELRRNNPVIDAYFGWKRPGGQLHSVDLRDYAYDLARLTTTPALKPGETPQEPPSGPIVVPRPDEPPKPPKPPTVPVGKLGAIVAAIAAVFSFWKRRK